MNRVDFQHLTKWLIGQTVERPNAANNGTLAGHAAGEPFEKLVYRHLKSIHPTSIFKQFEYLNDLYKNNPQSITLEDRLALFNSPVALFLLSRSDTATRDWSPLNVFEERQNDTADILYHDNNYFELIDVKTRNISKAAMPPNIISAYKVAQMCALLLENKEFENLNLCYVEIDWLPDGEKLVCQNAHFANLFKSNPHSLYINWAAAMQIQFHVAELDQTFEKPLENWAKEYLKMFVASAQHKCDTMRKKYVEPFIKYID